MATNQPYALNIISREEGYRSMPFELVARSVGRTASIRGGFHHYSPWNPAWGLKYVQSTTISNILQTRRVGANHLKSGVQKTVWYYGSR